MKDKNIGFIGLGIMGKAMALNLLKAGYKLFIINKSRAAGELVTAGAKAAADSKDLARQSDIIISMVPDSPQVEEILYGSEGILEDMKSGTIFVDMSTIAPSVAIKLHDKLKQKGIEALDAPVSGGQVGAIAGSLSIMVGGSEIAFQYALPLLEVMGKNIIHMGGPGAGQLTKACNQLIVGMNIQAVTEAFALAKKAGVDLKKLRGSLLGGFAQSRILDLHGQRIIDRNFEPGFRLALHRKDMNIVLQTAKDLMVPLYGASQVAASMDAAIAGGYGEQDHSVLWMLMERLSGIDQ